MARPRYVKGKIKVNLQLTSILDVMTILLVFLLKLFSADGQLLTQAENLALPISTSKMSPTETTLSVEISSDWVMVDHVPVARTEKVREQQEVAIEGVREKLEQAMMQEEAMVKIGRLQRVKGEVVMQIDKNVEYDVLFKVMVTCGEVGYNKIRLAVMGKEQEI